MNSNRNENSPAELGYNNKYKIKEKADECQRILLVGVLCVTNNIPFRLRVDLIEAVWALYAAIVSVISHSVILWRLGMKKNEN
jgi:hypothetical protein